MDPRGWIEWLEAVVGWVRESLEPQRWSVVVEQDGDVVVEVSEIGRDNDDRVDVDPENLHGEVGDRGLERQVSVAPCGDEAPGQREKGGSTWGQT